MTLSLDILKGWG